MTPSRARPSQAVANREARATSDAASAQRLAAWRSILPSLRAEAGVVRTTDPVGAFGTTLRQRQLTSGDFDPARLNYPDAISNYAAAVVLEQPLVILDGWMAARAATRSAEGATRMAEWTAYSTTVDVVRAYYGAVLAAEQANTVTAAARAAQAHARQAELMLEAGLVTRSDVLLASVQATDLEVERKDAVRDSVLALRQLGVLLGEPADRELLVPSRFPVDSVAERAAGELLSLTPGDRADVAMAVAGAAAADANVARARATLVPRIVSFARSDLNSSTRPVSGPSNWTVGIMASWTPFTGGSELADRQASQARLRGALAQLEGTVSGARLDLERTELTLGTALAHLSAARASVAQAAEAHRIVSRKYAGGLATVVELLAALAVETRASAGLSAARHALVIAMADRLRATGHDPARLAADLDDGSAITTR